MDVLYPAASWRPLGNPNSEPYIGVPRVLIFHTMVGYLAGTDSMFRRAGYDGTESHFGTGQDGRVWQWQRIDRQADTNYAANLYATSIETEDRANPANPWSAGQLDALVKLAAWWCRTTRNPARLVTSPGGRGIGYHNQFTAWNKSGHVCPGAVRLGQLRQEVVPRVARALNQPPPTGGNPNPDAPLSYRPEDRDGLLEMWEYDSAGRHDIRDAQGQLARARYPVAADGYFGPATRAAVVAFQGDHRLDVDGIIGPKTRAALRDTPGQPPYPFPLPSGDWFGPESSDPRNHSGYWAADRPHIAKIQDRLMFRGARGMYSAAVAAAVRRWQGSHGVAPADGFVGLVTWRAMFR